PVLLCRLSYSPFPLGICGQFLRQLHVSITGPFHSLLTFLPWLVEALCRRRTLGNFFGPTPAKSLLSAVGCLSCELFAGVLIRLVAGGRLIIFAIALALLVFLLALFLRSVLGFLLLLHIFASFSV